MPNLECKECGVIYLSNFSTGLNKGILLDTDTGCLVSVD